MTYGEFAKQLAYRFSPELPARVKISVNLAEQIRAMPDGTVDCEVVEVRNAFDNPDVMVLAVEAV